jgi:hypothetical protein
MKKAKRERKTLQTLFYPAERINECQLREETMDNIEEWWKMKTLNRRIRGLA